MSMTILVILRFLGIFAVYTGVTLALPALMFRRILRGRSLAEQFLMCYTFGNFYIINIVFLLQLLHISNFFTLAGLTAVLSIVIGGRVNRIPLKQQAGNTWHLFGKLLRGRMKLKSAIFLFLGKCAAGIKRLAKFFHRHIVKNPLRQTHRNDFPYVHFLFERNRNRHIRRGYPLLHYNNITHGVFPNTPRN